MISTHRRSVAFISLSFLCLVFAAAELIPGRFVMTDEVFYKAAGRNWAMTGHFAAPEIVGRLTQGPPLTEIYFAQPPLYTFFFGLYTKLVGFGPRTCILYDVLIHVLLVWSAVVAGKVIFRLPWSLAALSGALFLALGTPGRSDELGIVFALWAAIAFRSSLSRRSAALGGGALLGLCAATSLSALAFLGPLASWELIADRSTVLEKIRAFGLAVIAGLAVAAVCVAPILIYHPTAYKQLMEHAAVQSQVLTLVAGTGAVSATGPIQTWVSSLRYGPGYAALVIGLLAFAGLCCLLDKTRAAARYSRVLVAGLLLLGLIIAMPGKYLYFWYLCSWLILTCVALAMDLWPSIPLGARRLLVAVGACVWLAAAMPYFHSKAILWTLPPDQALTTNVERVRSQIPPGAGVMTSEYWWALADRDRVYDILFANPPVGQVNYIVVSGNGSGKPGKPQAIKAPYATPDFEVVYNHLNTTPESILGLPITRSAYGFGAYILQRKPDR